MKPSVIIAHPTKQFSYEVALALQEGSMLKNFLTGVWYPHIFPFASLAEIMPPYILTRLRERHLPHLEDRKVEQYPYFSISRFCLENLLKTEKFEEWMMFVESRIFDRWVAKRLMGKKFDIFIGFETACAHSFRVCKKRGIKCILYLAQIHWKEEEKIFDIEESRGNPIIFNREILPQVSKIKEEELSLADFIFVLSDFARDSLFKNGVPSEKIIKIPLGINPDLFQPKEKSHTQKTAPFVILYVGAITPRKGIKYLVEAYKQLSLPDARLILAGTWRGFKELKQHREFFNHIDYIPPKRLSDLYREADIFVFPSVLDSFAIVVIEAMASGLPVILTHNVGTKEIVNDGENGFVIPAGDVQMLKEKIKFFYKNREKIGEFGQRARQTALQFTLNRFKKDLCEAIANIWKKPI